jgi:hypothetical protein
MLAAAFSARAQIEGSDNQDVAVPGGRLLCTIQAHRNTLFEIDHHPRERWFV